MIYGVWLRMSDGMKILPMDCHICPICGKGVPSSHICPNLPAVTERTVADLTDLPKEQK